MPRKTKTRRERREALGQSIEAIARAVGCSSDMIRSCEKGRRSPSETLAQRWDAVLWGMEANHIQEVKR